MLDILFVVFRSVVVYLFIIGAIRLFGKKELSQLSVIDLVFVLLISNSVQNAMVGPDTTLLGGLVAAFTLFTLNAVLKDLVFKNKSFGKFLEGDPLMLVYKGDILEGHLLKAKITNSELEASIREHGLKSVKNVDLAILEVDGNISVLSHDFTKKTRKRRVPLDKSSLQ